MWYRLPTKTMTEMEKGGGRLIDAPNVTGLILNGGLQIILCGASAY
jgi:hypothetical protein